MLRNFSEQLFYRTPPVAASDHSLEKNHLGANLLKLLHSREDLSRVTSLRHKSHVKDSTKINYISRTKGQNTKRNVDKFSFISPVKEELQLPNLHIMYTALTGVQRELL